MTVDVITETLIDRPRAEVAAYVGDPDHAPAWYVNIKSVEWETPPPLRVGSRLAFVAHFLGRRLAYSRRAEHADDPAQPRPPIGLREARGAPPRSGHAPRQSQGPRATQGPPRSATRGGLNRRPPRASAQTPKSSDQVVRGPGTNRSRSITAEVVHSPPPLMRSRPDLKVWIHPSPVSPGEALRVTAVLASASETPTEGVEFKLTRRERSTGIVDGRYDSRECVWTPLVARHPGAVLTPGEHRYRAVIPLPRDSAPAYRSRMSSIEYVLEVRVDIPWWPDRVGEYEVPVALPSLGGAVEPAAGLYASSASRPAAELYVECSIDNRYLEPGGLLYGRVSFLNVHTATIRRVVVALVLSERLNDQPAPQPVERHTFTLHEGTPPEATQIPFALRLPDDLSPAFSATLFTVGWHLELIAESLWGATTLLSAPVTVLPRGSVRPQVERSVAGAPVVGADRRKLTWAPVARLFDFSYDEAHDVTRGTVGRVSVSIAVEQRLRDGFYTTARLRWSPLGVGLSIGPAQWSDRFSDREIKVGDAAFDDAFQVRGRFESQVRAVCEPSVRTLLAVSTDARVGDDEAVVSVRGALLNYDEVRSFTSHVRSLATALDRAMGQVPPPPEVKGEDAEVWRAFAERLHGRFEVGRVYVHDGAWGAERVSAGLRWSAEGEFEATALRVTIDPPLAETVDPDDPNLNERVRARIAELREVTEAITVRRDALDADLARRVTSPTSLEPVLDRMVTLVRCLQGRSEAAPYR